MQYTTTVRQAASQLGLSVSRVRTLCRAGVLDGVMKLDPGTRRWSWLINHTSVEALAQTPPEC